MLVNLFVKPKISLYLEPLLFLQQVYFYNKNMEIKKSAQLNCSAEELWSWLNNFEKVKQWNKSILDEKHLSEGTVRKGFLTKVLIDEETSKTWYNSEIIVYEPSSKLSFLLSGGNVGKNAMRVEYSLREMDGQTILSYKCTWHPKKLALKILAPVIKKVATKNIENALSTLKKLVDNS